MEEHITKQGKLAEVIKSIKSEIKKVKNSSSLAKLLLTEMCHESLITYKTRKKHSIFKNIFEQSNALPELELIMLTKDFLNISTDFGRSEILNLEDFDLEHLSKIVNNEAKIQILWSFVEIWSLKSHNYEQLKPRIVQESPSLKILLHAKENKFEELKVEFELLATHNFQDQCLAIARVASRNLNTDILEFLIFNEKLAEELKLKVVVLVCKAGLHQVLQIVFEKMAKHIRDIKIMMIEVFNAIMLRKTCKRIKSFKEVFLPEVNHYLCFEIIFQHKREIAFEFMRQALDADYEDIVLLFFKNGYYIGRKDGQNNSFLTICKNKELLVKILDNQVSMAQENGRCLKIDYRFLFDSLVNRILEFDQVSVEANSKIENDKKCFANFTEFLWKILNVINLSFFWSLMVLYSWTTTNFYTLCLVYIILRTFVKLTIHINKCSLRTKPRKSSLFSVKSFYSFMDYSFDSLLIVLVSLISGIFYEINANILGVAYPILLVLTGVEAILLLEPFSKDVNMESVDINPLQMIAHSKYFKSAINHPVLATYIEIMDQEFQMYYVCNCWIFVISSFTLVGWIIYPSRYFMFPYYLCPLYIAIRESIQLFLFGKIYFSSVVNWIEFGLILSGFVGYWNANNEDKTVFNVATATMIIAVVVELLILLSKIFKDILDIVTMFTKVILMYFKLILMFGFVLIGSV